MVVKGVTIELNGVKIEFQGSQRAGEQVWVGIKVNDMVFGPQGSQGPDDAPWEFGQGPNWALVIGTISSVKGKDGVWYIHFKGVIDVKGKPKGYNQNVITVEPSK